MIDELERELNRIAGEIKSDMNNLNLEDIISIYIDLMEEQKEAQEKFEADDKKGGKSHMELLREMRYAEKLGELVEALKIFEIWRNDSKSADIDKLINGLIDSLDAINSVRHYAPKVENV